MPLQRRERIAVAAAAALGVVGIAAAARAGNLDLPGRGAPRCDSKKWARMTPEVLPPAPPVLSAYVAPLALPASDAPAPPAPASPAPKEEKRPRVELAFVLDTTGSMGGLIDAAKRRIWAIASSVAAAKPSPEIRVALVAFRDRGDAYVTKVTDLSSDLDAVYAELLRLEAAGGGDGPESVNEGLRAAVTRLSWTKGDGVMRTIFLVGDAPPHMDYAQDVPWSRTCEDAVKSDIVIHALRCGGDPETARVWAEIAKSAEGSFADVDPSNARAVATPFDARLADLGGKLGASVLRWGTDDERRRESRKTAAAEEGVAAASAPEAKDAVAADRAGLLGRADRIGERDLLADLDAGAVDLDRLKKDELPEELRGMTADERKAVLAKRRAERDALQKEMRDLEEKRAAFLRKAEAEAATAGKAGFDAEVRRLLRKQAERSGLSFPAPAPAPVDPPVDAPAAPAAPVAPAPRDASSE